MELIEGVSNEVLLAFMFTLLLGLITIFYVFTNGTGDRSQANNSAETNADSPQTNVNGNTSQGTNDDNGIRENSTERQGVYTARTNYDSADFSQSDASSFERLRRRDTGDINVHSEESEQQRTIAVRVKHNENVQSFNISRNCTVVELKRLAFPNEMNSGKRVRFVFAGQLLRNDGDALTTYGVSDNTVVHCVITDQPQQTQPVADENEDLDLSRFLIPLLTVGLILSWYGLITYKHIFTGSSIAILMVLTSLYFILVYVTTVH